jgi:predicted nucleic acid-binding protein
LVALGFQPHEFHGRVSTWIEGLERGEQLLSCPLTELGFVRVLNQAPQYRVPIADSKALLAKLRTQRKRTFAWLDDTQGSQHLPSWVRTGRQTTDGHLAALAKAGGAVLATLDTAIPGSFVIPALTS